MNAVPIGRYRFFQTIDPIYLLKAIKNKKEIDNFKISHIYDGAALTKFLFWLKKNYNRKSITEISASKKLYSLRKKNKSFYIIVKYQFFSHIFHIMIYY